MAPQKGGRRLPWTRSRPKYVGQVGTDFAELSGIKPTRLEQLPDESSATPSENEEMEEEKPVGVGGPSVRRCPRPQSASQHVGQPGSECVQAECSLVRALPPLVPGCSSVILTTQVRPTEAVRSRVANGFEVASAVV